MKVKKRVIKTNVVLFFEFIFLLNMISGADFLQNKKLKFDNCGKFKIVQFADLHQNDCINLKTVHFMEKVMDYEKPDFVILTGDNIDGRYCMDITYEKAIESVVRPIEERRIPWAAVLGNHDTESLQVERKNMIKNYMKYKYNMNKITDDGIQFNLLVMDSENKNPIFNMYMLDSGSYSKKGGYGCIEPYEVKWYKKTVTDLKKKYGHIVPAFMFFHIPIIQYNEAWENEKLCGEKREKICHQSTDNGLFKEMQKEKDVKAIFVGHDHTNNFIGRNKGIIMGYGRCTGYDTYDASNYERGARVIYLDEDNINKFKTWERLDKDFK
ncbi:3',5'-cyclic AMP phosphodiesterase CpdA [Clostridium acetobutylicum]|uniref:Predicted phosphohydrolases, Icc family n=2 Tax=Clostridium acetobutylicum TaxID=1488 RepID=Q97HP8_CLOAB|nr:MULTISPECIES: metallophosphoesterase family protein [Clostridium]AAK79922.1 Predicted phosphohydrolases, Icc family [Clostridium acetobutylicum ATCC 824]ADZ21015.1 phosphohydrolase, Icc family [Clostridium acetobutylicum EA 2018]AEI32096.1 Icc family phosphohydrolase [Clostridium acetobutylicum DSM 1731]AWV82209.1 phosphohydrolase [Clostridium acetobutylicum]MBC2394381.1 metallophosphoesterase family protein [Clostridium acetobutylicum]